MLYWIDPAVIGFSKKKKIVPHAVLVLEFNTGVCCHCQPNKSHPVVC